MDFEEIKKALKADEDLSKKVALLAIETQAGKTILDNYAKIEVDRAVGLKTAEIYTNLDNDLFEVLGVRKPHEQKTYDFIKKVAGEYKELKTKEGELGNNDKVKELERELEELKGKGGANEHWKGVYQNSLETWKEEKQKLIESLKTQEEAFWEAQIDADLSKGLSSLSLKKDIPEAAIKALIEVKKKEIKEGAKLIEGKVVYHKQDGTPILNKEYTPISSHEIWRETLGDIIDSGTTTGGGGANPSLKKGVIERIGEGDTSKIKLILDTSTFSTKVEFNNLADSTLRKQGIEVGTKDYNKALEDAYTRYEVGKLDLQ